MLSTKIDELYKNVEFTSKVGYMTKGDVIAQIEILLENIKIEYYVIEEIENQIGKRVKKINSKNRTYYELCKIRKVLENEFIDQLPDEDKYNKTFINEEEKEEETAEVEETTKVEVEEKEEEKEEKYWIAYYYGDKPSKLSDMEMFISTKEKCIEFINGVYETWYKGNYRCKLYNEKPQKYLKNIDIN